jgi:3-phenylpropionate/cinnamic acid dioxygenase small subunit
MTATAHALPTASAEDYVLVCNFLAHEARLLDENRLDEWYDLLAEDFSYEMPVRVALRRAATELDPLAEFKTGVHHTEDTKGSVKIRISRLQSGYAWSEDPPSRTVRSVGSISVNDLGNGLLAATNAILLYRERGREPEHQFIAANRSDVLRKTDNGLQLVDRKVYLAHTIVNTPNLGLFF